MKLLVVLLAVGYVVCEEQIALFYHDSVGVELASKIKAFEESADFDGSRISGGNAAGLGVHPHLGGLLINLTDGRTSVCGSSLLTRTRSVTAAHCWFDGRNFGLQIEIVLGSVLLFSGGTRVKTSEVELHANFNPDNHNNDIAIIIFDEISYSPVIQPVELPRGMPNYQFANSWAWAVGFGATGDNAPITTNQFLSEVQVQVIANTACSSTYGSAVVNSGVICVNTSGGRSTCSGDSGGPLWLWIGGNRVLIGVSSFGHVSGCQRDFPAGFVRVTNFVSWIHQRL